MQEDNVHTPSPQPAPQLQPVAPQPPVAQPQQTQVHHSDVLGILSIVMGVMGFGVVGLPLGLLGARKAKKEGRDVVLSRIGWIYNLVLIILVTLVIAIIFISIPFLQNSTLNTTKKNELLHLKSDLEYYQSVHGHYPATLSELKLNRVLTDVSGNPFSYTPFPIGCTLDCETYELRTTLKDGEVYKLESDRRAITPQED